uniref:60S ribosomal protein L18a-like protein n=1 Tax=Rhizophora mucronata TaxID=61149 RepID=A0A2P2J0Z2_RHIMU
MREEDQRSRATVVGHQHEPPPQQQYHYGTFQGVANYPQPQQQPVIGFPQPVPPPGATEPSASPQYYDHVYQTVPGYAVAEGRPVRVRELRLPCCGIGIGWFL